MDATTIRVLPSLASILFGIPQPYQRRAISLGFFSNKEKDNSNLNNTSSGGSASSSGGGGAGHRDSECSLRDSDDDNDIELQPLRSSTHVPLFLNCPHKPMLSVDHVQQLLPSLPAMNGVRDLKLLYATSIHGYSLTTFFHRVSGASDTLLIIQDEDAHVFGCYTPTEWEINDTYYGNPTCVLFTLHPLFHSYKATLKNHYFMLAKHDYIAIGGGDHFALWLDSSFRDGQSLPCLTFDSPSLSKRPHFKCTELEVWAFV